MATEKITVTGNVYAFASKKATEQAIDMLVGVIPADKKDAAKKKITGMLIDDFKVEEEVELPDKDDWDAILAALPKGLETAKAICREQVKTSLQDKIRAREVKARQDTVSQAKDKVMKILANFAA